MAGVLLLIISTVSYTLSALGQAHQQVARDISDFSRGSYDLLIRPPGARTDLEKKLNMVEENYLGNGAGGITLQQWQDIKNHPQVEIAAPVASIGLFTAKKRTWMLERKEEDARYYGIEYETSDGVHSYSKTKSDYLYDFGNKAADFTVYPSADELLSYYNGWTTASFAFPATYHQVAAVDPEEEGKLTNYDFSPLTAHPSDYSLYENGQFSMPIMSLSDVTVPIKIKLTLDDLADVSKAELKEWNKHFLRGNHLFTLSEKPSLYYKVMEDIISKKRLHKEKVFELNPDKLHSPFMQDLLYVNEDMKLISNGDPFKVGGAFDVHSQRIGYRMNPVVYEVKDQKHLAVKKTGEDKVYGAPTYREIEEIEFYKLDDLKDEDFFGFIQTGTFSIKEKADSLASAPLGIYGRDMPHLASNPSVKLHPSAVPGSFVSTPAHGLISIEWAEKAKGTAPIDAIRVKASGLKGYDKEGAARIRALAAEWEKEGYTVDIVAGSSLTDLTVEVEGLGKVVQRFTSLGAADTVLDSWNALQAALTVLYGLVALTFVAFSFYNLLADRQKDERLLIQLGWPQPLIRLMRRKEWGIIIGFPVLTVSAGFTAWGIAKDEWLPLLFTGAAGIVCIGMYIIAEQMQKNQMKPHIKQRGTVTAQNIRFYQYSLLASCIQLFLTSVLTCFLPFFLAENVSRTKETRLGTYVHGEIEGLFAAVIVLLYILSLTTVWQSLSRMWEKREGEMRLFVYLGWEVSAIRKYFLKEVLIWGGASVTAGWAVSLLGSAMMAETALQTFGLQAAGALLILGAAMGSAAFSLKKAKAQEGDTHAH